MQPRLLLFACFFIPMVTGSIDCWSQQYPFVHYTPREGLVNNRARFIYQDSKGRLYVSTYGGLSIYDGSRFTNYTTANGLSENLVNDVIEMGDDSVWIIPNVKKIHCMVRGQLKDFVPADGFCPAVNQVLKTSNGTYYAFAEEGLFRLQDKRFIQMPMDTVFKGQVIKTFLQGYEWDHKLYILSNPDYKLPCPNLLVYDLIKKKLVACNTNEWIAGLNKGLNGELWLPTPRGLLAPGNIDEETGTAELNPLPYIFPIAKDAGIYSNYVDKQNNIWLITTKGVYRIKSNEATLFTSENGLITNYQSFLFQDAENNIWFTNGETGISKLSNQQLAFYPSTMPGYSISDVFSDVSTDSVWMHDIYHHKIILLLRRGVRKEFENQNESLSVLAKFVSGNKKWLVCGHDIYEVHIKPGVTNYSSKLFFRDSGTMGFSYATKDKDGNLIAVSGNLVVITGNKILTAPVHYLADQLTIDKDNRIWVVNRSNRLYCFRVSGYGDSARLSLLSTYDSIAGSSPRSIVSDQSGNIWIGTRTAGIFYFSVKGLRLQLSRQITMQNGLSENFISYLYCDKDNNIWACTPSGLDRIKMVSNNFLVENITRSNNFYFPVSKIQQTASGVFWILSGQGLISYDPRRPVPGKWKPQLLFSEVLVNNNPIALNNKNRFKYFQNNIVFQLAAPTYTDEKQTRFSYLLEGSGNNSWSTPSSNASVNLVNLAPGAYTLKAKAIFLHGLYPNTETAYSFTILPPWWQTIWFKLSLASFVAGLLFLAIGSYFKRRLQLQLMMLERKQAIEKERTRIATDMHDDLGAGLSRIKFLSETIGLKKQQHLPIEEEINSIRTYSHEMIDKMGEIVWALNEKNDSLEDLLSYTRSYAVEYLQENGIRCKVNEPNDIPQIMVSGDFRRNIYLTVKETLHNIVKHAQATDVLIEIKIEDCLCIEIRDNGIGVDTASLVSSGNGLPSMSTRIQGLNGSFKISGDNGTKVSIEVPINV